MSSLLSKLINLAGNITGTLAVSNGGTGVTSSTGSGSVVLSTSPTLVTPTLGTPASGNLSNCSSYPVVTSSTAGLVPSANTSLDNASATRLGLMQYLHGGSYSGGGAPTVTLSSGGGTLSTVYRAVFIPYQMNDGTWRIRISVSVGLSSASRSVAVFAINGITFNASYVDQMGTGFSSAAVTETYAVASSNTVEMDYPATATTTFHGFAGDFELSSKPTWAY